MTDLAEIKAALAKTTQGEWIPPYATEDGIDLFASVYADAPTSDDRQWIADAHNVYVPWLIAEVERLRKDEEQKP